MAEGELASVMVRLTADAGDFIAGMDQATDELTKFAEGAAALTAAGVVIGGALTGAKEYASSFETQIFNLNQQTGIATETLSALGVAAQTQGKSLDSVQVALRKLGQEAEDALISPYSKAAAVFNNLGVSLYDTTGKVKPLEQVLADVSNGLSRVGNSTERVGLASDLFGRTSMALLPILGSGTDALNKWAEVAEKAGVKVSQSQADQGKAFMLIQNMAENSFKGFAIAVGTALIPALEDAEEYINEYTQDVIRLVHEHPMLIAAIGGVAAGLVGAGGLVTAITAVTAAANFINATLLTTGAEVTALGVKSAVTNTILGDTSGALFAVGGAAAATEAELAFAGTGFVSSGIAMLGLGGVIVGLTPVMYTFRNEWAELATSIGSTTVSAIAKAVGAMAGLASSAASFMKGLADVTGNANFGKLADGLSSIHDSLETTKFSLEETSKDWADQSEQFSHATESSAKLDDVLKQLMVSLKGNAGAHLGNMNAVREHDSAVKALVESVTGEKGGYDILTPALEQLMKLHENDYVIINKLGPKITEYTDHLLVHGDAVNAVLQYYRDLTVAKNTDNGASEKMLAAQLIVAKVLAEDAAGLRSVKESLEPATKAWDAYYTNLNKLMTDDSKYQESTAKLRINLINEDLAADTTYATKLKEIKLQANAMKEAADASYADYYRQTTTLMLMHDVGYSDASQIIQKEMIAKSLAEYKQYEAEYNKLLKLGSAENTKYWENFYTSEDQAAQKMEISMAKAMGSISTGMADVLAKGLVTWHNWESSLISLAQNVATQMLSAFLGGFLNPLTNALQSVGKSLSNMLFNLIGGIGGGILGGITGGIGGLGAGTTVGFPFAEEGTPFVEKTGLAVLHYGERVITASDNAQIMSPGPSIVTSASSSVGGGIGTPGQTNNILMAILNSLQSHGSGDASVQTNDILSAILSAVKQGQKIVVNGQVLGQITATTLRNRSLVAASVSQAGK